MTSNRFITRAVRMLVSTITCVGMTSTVHAQQTRYAIQDLSPGNGSASAAVAINDAGIVAGRIEISHATRAARARAGRPLELVPGLELRSSSTSDVNATGDLTGWVQTSSDPYTVQAIRYTDSGGSELLGSLGGNSYGVSINRSGQVAGWSYAGSAYYTRAFLATPGQGLQDLGTLGGLTSFATGINDAGQVAGHSDGAGGRWHAFRFTPGQGMRDLATPDDINMYAGGINASGQVVGRTDRSGTPTHAFRYTDGVGLQDLHTMAAGASAAVDINDAGAVVGYLFTPGAPTPRAFVYTDTGGMVDLNTLVDPQSGWILTSAWGINNAGEIVGEGKYKDDLAPRAFKLTPRAVDTTPPAITAIVADPASLWPANLQMVPVTITVSVTDNTDPAPQCRILNVTSSDVVDAGAMQVTGDLTLDLRAERRGLGTGRKYLVSVGCSDASGNSASGTAQVAVPHDRGGGLQ